MVERPSTKVSDEQSTDKADGGSSVQIPASPQPIDIASARAKAEELLKRLA